MVVIVGYENGRLLRLKRPEQTDHNRPDESEVHERNDRQGHESCQREEHHQQIISAIAEVHPETTKPEPKW